MSYALRSSGWQRLKALSPFGLGRVKPKHYRDMLRVLWRNRDNLGYGWKVLAMILKSSGANYKNKQKRLAMPWKPTNNW